MHTDGSRSTDHADETISVSVARTHDDVGAGYRTVARGPVSRAVVRVSIRVISVHIRVISVHIRVISVHISVTPVWLRVISFFNLEYRTTRSRMHHVPVPHAS